MFVVQVHSQGQQAPTVGQACEVADLQEGIELVVELAKGQCETPEDDIREEVTADYSFADPNGEWTIAICATEEE